MAAIGYPLGGGGKYQPLDDDGSILPGGKLYTYVAGTSTLKSTFTTAAMTTAHANPVVLDANGRKAIYMDPLEGYKLVLQRADGTEVWNEDAQRFPDAAAV